MVWVVHFFFLFTGSNKIVLAADHCKLAGRTLKKCFWYHFFWSTASLCLTVSKYRALHKKDPYHHRENGSQILTIFWHPIRATVMNTTTAMSLGWFILWKIRVGQIFLDIHFLFCKKSLVTISVTLSNFDHKQLLVRWFILRFFAHNQVSR